jgi:hypothetical protein
LDCEPGRSRPRRLIPTTFDFFQSCHLVSIRNPGCRGKNLDMPFRCQELTHPLTPAKSAQFKAGERGAAGTAAPRSPGEFASPDSVDPNSLEISAFLRDNSHGCTP